MSGNIWINFIQPTDSDPNTTENMTFVEGYIQENSHNAPQVALSMSNNSTCSSCSGSNQMVISTDPSVIMQLNHNAIYTIYIKARVSGFRMMPPGALTPYDVTQTVTVTGNNLLITQAPDYVIQWDPSTMSSLNFSCTTTDAQTGLQQYKYTISGLGGSVEKTFNNQSRPGQHSFTWDGKNASNVTMPKGLYSTKMDVISNIPTVSGDSNRSGYLSIPSFSVTYSNPDDTDPRLRVTYSVADSASMSAKDGILKLYNPDLDLLSSSSLGNKNTSSSGIIYSSDINYSYNDHWLPKYYTGLLGFTDDHHNDYKNHQDRLCMEAQDKFCVPEAHNYDGSDFGIVGSAAFARSWQKKGVGTEYLAYKASSETSADAHDAMADVQYATIIHIVDHADPAGGWISFG